jgi:predicted heme/steroid binding protein
MGGGRGGGGGGGGDNGAFAPPSSSAAARGRVVSLAELKSHSAPGNCWLAIEGKVYDVSQWADHPGGRVLYSAAGADATDTFRAFHNVVGAQAQRRLELSLQRFEIGTLAAEAAAKVAPSAFEEDYRKLYEVVRNSPEYAKAK